jgi:hypothetical protein
MGKVKAQEFLQGRSTDQMLSAIQNLYVEKFGEENGRMIFYTTYLLVYLNTQLNIFDEISVIDRFPTGIRLNPTLSFVLPDDE